MDIIPVTLRSAAELHMKDLKGLQDLKTGTIKNYGVVYNRLAAFIEELEGREALASDVTAETIEAFFRDYVALHSPAAYPQRRSNCRAIVQWLMRRRYIEPGINFVDDLPARRTTTRSKRARYISDEEFLRLLKCAKRTHPRNYFLALFVRLTGRRIGEVVGDADDQEPLVWADIRWDTNVIEWDNNKGRKLGKEMPMTPRIRAVLEAWREVYCRELGVEQPHATWIIFPSVTPVGPSRKGHTRRCILAPKHRMTNPDKVLRPILEAAGLRRGAGDSWHMLRKAFANQRKQAATNQNRADAWELTQIALDHQDVKTTRIYVDDREDYDRYAEWANSTPELATEVMALIPELSAVALPAPQQEEPASEVATTESDDIPSGAPNVVDFAAFARGRRALA